MILEIFYIILALITIGILIFIHELGHFWVGKKVGMRIETFSIGLGPVIKKWRRNDVTWQLCWFPFGGFVRFGGMEKENGKEPHEIKDGFFGKAPKDRIKVALAGPLVNLIFAFLLFSMIWAFGGRNKPFSEYTKHIGWVDTKSELYANSVKPGDEIIRYGGKKFKGFQDLIYFSAINKDMEQIQGYKVNYFTGTRKAFDYKLATYSNPVYEGLRTIGVLSLAQYLIYDELPNNILPMAENSPMKGSGLALKDRLLWVDGELIFSQQQLSEIINRSSCFLTVQRHDQTFHTKVDRLKLEEMVISSYDLSEIDDWRYGANIQQELSNLYFIPYNCSENCIVENAFGLVDIKMQRQLLENSQRGMYTVPLQKGDRILAVDGMPVSTSTELFKQLQTRKVLVIVQKNFPRKSHISWKNADDYFSKFPISDLETIVNSIGTENVVASSQDVALLRTVEPMAFSKLSFSHFQQDYDTYRKQILKQYKDPQKQKKALEQLEKQSQRLSLGIALQDQQVRYNPNPVTTFVGSFTEIWRTLFSFISGYLHPKFLLGPVGMIQSIQKTWAIGWKEAMFWVGVISLNLGILNLLPIPVLDGGHVLFSCIEWITKKPIKPKTLERLILPFVLLLVAAIIFMTYNDILRIIKGFW